MESQKEVKNKMQEGITEISVASTRLKIVEERYNILRKKSQVTDQNIIEFEKNQYEEFRLLNDDLMEVKHKLKDLSDKMELITEEVENFADKRDFLVLKRYVDFWEPMEFVTRKQINDFLRKKFND